jgi:uncharacterized protein
VLFAASTLHAGVGFGSALVAMPLLSLVLGVDVATPLVGLAVPVTLVLVLARSWQSLDLHATARLLIGSACGIPVGVIVLRQVPASVILSVLGSVLVAYGLWGLLRPVLPRLRWTGAGYLFGACAGVLGGACNINGPPVVLFGALSGWDPARFRATLSGYFLPTAMLICAAHAATGLWSVRVFELFFLALPVLLLGNWCGLQLARRIPAERFSYLLHWLLVVLGTLMFL